ADRQALTWIRTRAPELRAKLLSCREGWVCAGLTAAAVFICLVVSGSGVMAGMALAFSRKPPDVSALYAPPDEATPIYGTNTELIASLYRENRASVPLQGIPDELREAVIAIEDDRFYQHHGADFRGNRPRDPGRSDRLRSRSRPRDRKSTRLNSSHVATPNADFC